MVKTEQTRQTQEKRRRTASGPIPPEPGRSETSMASFSSQHLRHRRPSESDEPAPDSRQRALSANVGLPSSGESSRPILFSVSAAADFGSWPSSPNTRPSAGFSNTWTNEPHPPALRPAPHSQSTASRALVTAFRPPFCRPLLSRMNFSILFLHETDLYDMPQVLV